MSCEDLLEEVFALIYDNDDSIALLRRRPHLLANVFSIFSIAALLDLGLTTVLNHEADIYSKNARRSLNLKCIFSSADVDTILAIGHIGSFQATSTSKEMMNSAWLMTSIAVKIAEKVRHRAFICDWMTYLVSRFHFVCCPLLVSSLC